MHNHEKLKNQIKSNWIIFICIKNDIFNYLNIFKHFIIFIIFIIYIVSEIIFSLNSLLLDSKIRAKPNCSQIWFSKRKKERI